MQHCIDDKEKGPRVRGKGRGNSRQCGAGDESPIVDAAGHGHRLGSRSVIGKVLLHRPEHRGAAPGASRCAGTSGLPRPEPTDDRPPRPKFIIMLRAAPMDFDWILRT